MKRRLPISLLAIAVLLLALPAAAGATTTYVEFRLATDNGLEAKVETSNGKVALEIVRGERDSVTYEVPGEFDETGLKARFGSLGSIDVAFTPTKTLHADKPPRGCQGEPSTYEEGNFTGTIQFRGERDYVRIEQTQTTGEVIVYRESEWRCGQHRAPKQLRASSRATALNPRDRGDSDEDEATLIASGRCGCALIVVGARDEKGRGPTIIVGGRTERREGMTIDRLASTFAAPAAFTFDHRAGTARVRPPRPFSGSATFKRRPGRDLWRGTIRVPLLGADPQTFGGRDFRATLSRELDLE